MSKLSQSYTINLSSAASFDIYLEDVVDVISLIGTAGGNVQIQKAGGSTNVEGLMLTFKFAGDMATNTLTLFGEAIKYTGSKQWTATCLYRNSAWEVRVMPDFEEDQIIETSHIKDLNVTAGKLSASLDLTAKTLTNVNIGSGAIDGTVIGANSKAAVSTSALVADTAAINGGTIDAVVIGGVTPAAASFTTIGASGNITGNLVGNVTGNVTGDATRAATLVTARTIAGVSFNGSANISIPPENLTGVTAVANDLNLLAGAEGAGVKAADVLAITGFDGVVSSDGTTLTVASNKKLSLAGTFLRPVATTAINYSVAAGVDTVLGDCTGGGITVTLPGAATNEGRSIKVSNYKSSDNVLTVDTVSGDIYSEGLTYSSTTLVSGESLTFVSDGTDWVIVVNPKERVLEDTGNYYGRTKTIVLCNNYVKAKLDTTVQNLWKFYLGDIITEVTFFTKGIAGGACKVDIGGDADWFIAGSDVDAFLVDADANVKGVYSSKNATYAGDEIFTGWRFVEKEDTAYMTIQSSTDQTASGTLNCGIVITYIPT